MWGGANVNCALHTVTSPTGTRFVDESLVMSRLAINGARITTIRSYLSTGCGTSNRLSTSSILERVITLKQTVTHFTVKSIQKGHEWSQHMLNSGSMCQPVVATGQSSNQSIYWLIYSWRARSRAAWMLANASRPMKSGWPASQARSLSSSLGDGVWKNRAEKHCGEIGMERKDETGSLGADCSSNDAILSVPRAL